MLKDESILWRRIDIERTADFADSVIVRLMAESPVCAVCGVTLGRTHPPELADVPEGPRLLCGICAGADYVPSPETITAEAEEIRRLWPRERKERASPEKRFRCSVSVH